MGKSSILAVVAFLAAIAFMISTIVVAVRLKDREDDVDDLEKNVANLTQALNKFTVNPCDGAKKKFADILGGLKNTKCYQGDDESDVSKTVPPQAGADVTLGVVGKYDVKGQFTEGKGPKGFEDLLVPKPIMTPYSVEGLCPVNVHWHLGTEHKSTGQYDGVNGKGPTKVRKRRLDGSARQGGQCTLYNKNDKKFTKPFDWKHCDTHMEVGQTYEVHWPHSKLGACGTRWQYQTPFYDGVTCDLSKIEPDRDTDTPILSQHVGVQAQIFVIVNDEDNPFKYYYHNLIGGMIVDGTAEPPFGTDMAIYTGSTTGTSRNNTECSAWGPITWQVDRKCHMISASSFDKMCADMKRMPDDMTKDLEAHGSREVVDEDLAIEQVTYPTMSPTASPTASPIASTASPTASPIASTVSPTVSP